MSAPPTVEDRNKAAVVVSQLLGVFLVIITLLTQREKPLQSRRPTGPKTQTLAPDDQNRDKPARLWDDPLEGLLTFQVGASLISSSSTPTSSLSLSPSPSPAASTTPARLSSPVGETPASPTVSPEPSRRLSAAAQAQIVEPAPQNPGIAAPLLSTSSVSYTFLWNIVDARELVEMTERRLRTRYALVSAILAEGYLPLRESVLKPLFKPGSETSPVKEQIGRFETFRKSRGEGTNTWEYVSVIWIPKQLDSVRLPIDPYTLSQIETQICQQDIRDPFGIAITVDTVWFLHHGNSGDLVNLSVASASPPQNTSFLRATVPLPPAQAAWKSLQKITTDEVLVTSLVAELSLRIPALHNRKKAPRVVVFTESDTTYSRAITGNLRKRLEEKNVGLEIYSYLRGLEGRSDEGWVLASKENSTSQEPTGSLLQQRGIQEPSSGTSQFDYLRRTALELKARPNGRQDVVAVGVLGSDIYDKMVVLRAVRPVLPAAVFFTTDLDALYLERAEEPLTRNLVVASADDIDVNESDDAYTEGRRLPLMRDSYQTVLVKEVRNILRSQDRQTGSSATPTPTPPVARIFEIGAGERVDLTSDRPVFWPLWWLAQWWFPLLIFVLALLNAFLVLWAVTTRNRESSPRGEMKKWAKWVVYSELTLAGGGVLVLLFILTLWNPIFRGSDFLFGEPLSLGISMWPSIMIRSLAFGVAIYLLSRAFYAFVVDGGHQIEALQKTLAERIEFPFHRNRGDTTFWRLFDRVRKLLDKVVSQSVPTFRRLFDLVRKSLGTVQFRWEWFDPPILRCRIVTLSIAYLFVSFLLFSIWQPTVPGRGGSALLIEKIVLALGVGLYIVHLMFCLDLHFSAFRLLCAIRSHFDSEHEQKSAKAPELEELKAMLTSLGTLTTVIGKTLLYPLTVLILIVLSRLKIFDNWAMTPSLMATFLLGAIVLIVASLALWAEGARLKRVVLKQRGLPRTEPDELLALNNGVFAAWYKQPIFSAILSVLAVFGTISVAALIRLFSESY